MRGPLIAALLAAGCAAVWAAGSPPPLGGQTGANNQVDPSQRSVLNTRPAEVRLQYESLKINSGENLGLAAVGFLMDFGSKFYAGATGFGALVGERGGFFTGGVSLGLKPPVSDVLRFDVGGFLGGGGGGSAPQGGGMMVRVHAGATYSLGSVEAGGGVSWVKFPNGEVDSGQAYVSLSTRFLETYGPSTQAGQTLDSFDPSGAGLRIVETEWLAIGGAYLPLSGVETTQGTPMTSTISLVGVEYRRHLNTKPLYFLFQAAGAAGGRSDGYAEMFGGLGLRLPLIRGRLFGDLNATGGGGGGGSVDTSGGVAGKVQAGLNLLLTTSLSVGWNVGRIASTGSFSAESYQGRVGYRFGDARMGGGVRQRAETDSMTDCHSLVLAKWRLGAVHQTVLDAKRKASDPENLNLIGLRFDRFFEPWLYVTGQALAAHSGHAGGYAMGLLGLGVEHRLDTSEAVSVAAELTGGGSGGGGVNVGGGSTFQAQAGIHIRTRSGVIIQAAAGRTLASPNRLNSVFVSIGLAFDFARPEGPP